MEALPVIAAGLSVQHCGVKGQ
uniref:Uncharacterized protein n=1 Tax=Anguilla anguilla TaxID=7936 RepID=A0A0E9W3M1_ANGAN